MSQYARLSAIVILVALVTTPLQAANKFWLGGTGNLTDTNYSDGITSPSAPTTSDILFLGDTGTVTHSVAGTTSIQKLRVGHNQSTPGGQGAATLTVNNGAVLNLTVGGSNANGSLWVGNDNNGTLNIDGAGTTINATQVAQIGWGNNVNGNASGVVNITNGGFLNVQAGAINLGNFNGTNPVGVPGTLTMSGATSKITGASSLNVGMLTAPGTYSQTGGTATYTGAITVGAGASSNSSFTVSGGTVQTTSITIGETAATAINVSGSITGNAVINVTTNHFNVGLGATQGASLLVADNADVNILNTATSTGNMFIGRDTSKDTTFTMTGGTIDTGRNFLMGSGVGATGILGNQSGGTITTTLNFVLSDTGGASTYNLSGTGAIVANDLMIVGRQSNTGVMNQSGGSVTVAHGLSVGNAQSATTTLWGTGTYNARGGTITANQTTGTALQIAPQGTGTFRVIGDDASIDVNGNMTVNAGGGAQGTLAFQLETGDLLSLIDVSGVATFNLGAILHFDTSLASPTQTTYDLLTATSIVDSGITKNFPAGWDYHIITGGNGQILQAFQPPVGLLGDFNSDTKVDAADYATWRKNEVANAALPNDNSVGNQPARFDLWRANFGNPPGSGSALSAGQVPEPASVLLCVAALVSLIAIRRR
jgi:hypothetical protein